MTRDEDGLMGSWWGRSSARSRPVDGSTDEGDKMPREAPPNSKGPDCMNHGVLWENMLAD